MAVKFGTLLLAEYIITRGGSSHLNHSYEWQLTSGSIQWYSSHLHHNYEWQLTSGGIQWYSSHLLHNYEWQLTSASSELPSSRSCDA